MCDVWCLYDSKECSWLLLTWGTLVPREGRRLGWCKPYLSFLPSENSLLLGRGLAVLHKTDFLLPPSVQILRPVKTSRGLTKKIYLKSPICKWNIRRNKWKNSYLLLQSQYLLPATGKQGGGPETDWSRGPCDTYVSFLESVQWWLARGEKEGNQEEDTDESEEWKRSILISRKCYDKLHCFVG